jgi:hypothetical protein
MLTVSTMLPQLLRLVTVVAQFSPVVMSALGYHRLALAVALVVVFSSPGASSPRRRLRGVAAPRP